MTVKDNENTIPKIYTYTVDGFYTEHENEAPIFRQVHPDILKESLQTQLRCCQALSRHNMDCISHVQLLHIPG